jgi:hypothetical protein
MQCLTHQQARTEGHRGTRQKKEKKGFAHLGDAGERVPVARVQAQRGAVPLLQRGAQEP